MDRRQPRGGSRAGGVQHRSRFSAHYPPPSVDGTRGRAAAQGRNGSGDTAPFSEKQVSGHRPVSRPLLLQELPTLPQRGRMGDAFSLSIRAQAGLLDLVPSFTNTARDLNRALTERGSDSMDPSLQTSARSAARDGFLGSMSFLTPSHLIIRSFGARAFSVLHSHSASIKNRRTGRVSLAEPSSRRRQARDHGQLSGRSSW